MTAPRTPWLIELPEYKTPNGRTVSIYVWDKVKDYLSKAGTTIFIASIVLWFVLNLGPEGFVSDVSHSFAAIIGHVLVPVLRPAGLGQWQVAVALISGLCKGSGCLQFQRSVRNQQCKLRCRYDSAFHSACHGWFWRCERLCPDDILSPVFTLYRGSGNH